MRVLHRCFHGGPRPVCKTDSARNHMPLPTHGDLERLSDLRVDDPRIHRDTSVDERGDSDGIEIAVSHRLGPNGLPDSGCACIEDAGGLLLPVLLTPRNVPIGGWIFRAH